MSYTMGDIGDRCTLVTRELYICHVDSLTTNLKQSETQLRPGPSFLF